MDTDKLKQTWASVLRHGDDVASYFYAHLFVTHPEVRDMFPLVMDGQRDRLVTALGRIVSSVDQLDAVVPYVQQLGKDHRKFAVVAEQYDAVGASLLWTLRHFLGPEWTEDVARDWAAAYGVVAGVMTGAAEESEAEHEPAWWEAEVVDARRVSREVAIVRVVPGERLEYASGQSVAVSIPQAPRVWRYYSPANAPRQDGLVEFQVGLVPGGTVSTPFVSRLRVGDRIKIGAPVGTALVIDPAGPDDLLMVAGSTGIAPFLAILDDIETAWAEGRTRRRVHLVHGSRYAWNLYARARLAELARQSWFGYTEVVSDDPTFPGIRGLVGDVAAGIRMPGVYDALVCGSPLMTSHTITRLTDAAAPPRLVGFEEFDVRPDPTGLTSGVLKGALS